MSLIPFLAPIESRFVWKRAQPWLAEEYPKIGIYASTVYMFVIFLGKWWMRDKPAYSLRRPLAMWNTGLVVFSAVGFLSLSPTFARILIDNGFQYSVCTNWVFNTTESPHLTLWCTLFYLSKVIELGDTVFIVLRKTPLNFLHWYHHVTVLLYTVYFSAEAPAVSIWFGITNYFVHLIMYSYYMLKAAGFRVPRSIAQVITILQLAQFVMALVAAATAYILKSSGVECDATYDFLNAGLAMYVSYFLLFLNFFCQRYVLAKKKKC